MTSRAPVPIGPGARRRTLGERLFALLPMSAVWVLLWGELSWANVIGGILVGAAVTAILPLPPLHLEGRLRPLGLMRLVLHFCWDLAVSSAQVAWVAVRPRRDLRNAIIAVPLRVGSDLNVALTAEAVTLVPGSIVVEAVREAGVLYVHLLDVRDTAQVERSRQRVLDVEQRVIRAVGSRAEMGRVTRGATTPERHRRRGGNSS